MHNTAVIIDQLDLVITVDSAIAHLAGAVGKRVWMLNRTTGCWRWGWTGVERTPWYSSMRIFAQTQPYEWAPIIEQVRKELAVLT